MDMNVREFVFSCLIYLSKSFIVDKNLDESMPVEVTVADVRDQDQNACWWPEYDSFPKEEFYKSGLGAN